LRKRHRGEIPAPGIPRDPVAASALGRLYNCVEREAPAGQNVGSLQVLLTQWQRPNLAHAHWMNLEKKIIFYGIPDANLRGTKTSCAKLSTI